MNTNLQSIESISLGDYSRSLKLNGVQTYKDQEGFYWRKIEAGVISRLPVFNLQAFSIPKKTISNVLFQSKSLFATHILPCSEEPACNASWYQCSDQEYSIVSLHSTTRRHIRRSLRELTYTLLDWKTLEVHGFNSYKDTRERNGLSDGTKENFDKKLSTFLRISGHHILGAWKDDTLVAFMTLTIVDNWVEIWGYSSNSGLKFRPNNGLIHVILEHFLTERKFKLVSYGFSSIQEKSNAKGLHDFKLKCGFIATPIHRKFSYNRLLSPFINNFTYKVVKLMLVAFPKNRWLKKGGGMLSRIIKQK